MFHVYVESIFNHIRQVSYFTFGTSICHWSSNWQMSMFLFVKTFEFVWMPVCECISLRWRLAVKRIWSRLVWIISVPDRAAIWENKMFLYTCSFFLIFVRSRGVVKKERKGKEFILCSPSRLPSPQFSGNSSVETQQFHVRCVKNYVHWPVTQERSIG